MNDLMIALAQTAPTTPTRGSPASGVFMLALMAAVIGFMLLTARSQKKREKRKRDDMYTRLAKNDRVLTIGGVLGTVNTVKDNEVVLKVDESANVKMTFTKSAIQRIIEDDKETLDEKR